jgi:hypothetical protein
MAECKQILPAAGVRGSATVAIDKEKLVERKIY